MPTKPKYGGRKKGSQNKSTIAVKTAILNAFKKVGEEDYLVTVAREDPKTFCTLLGKVLPMEISGADGAGITVQIVKYADDPASE